MNLTLFDRCIGFCFSFIVESLTFRDKTRNLHGTSGFDPSNGTVMHMGRARLFERNGLAARSLTTNTRTLCQRFYSVGDTFRGTT